MVDSSSQAKLIGGGNPRHRVRILIADGHVLFAEGCRSLLEPEFHVVGIESDGRMLVKSAAVLQPDVVILDISMPQLNGLDAGEQIKTRRPNTKLIYVTVTSDLDIAAEAFRRGASGYLLKHGDIEELRTAVRRVLRGVSYVSLERRSRCAFDSERSTARMGESPTVRMRSCNCSHRVRR
jgi:DNA-binding NarL/FixJ family response regulator